jgi:putative ABC transport system ATP-binding protein
MSGEGAGTAQRQTAALIELRDVWREFDGGAVVALRGVDLSIAPGQLVGVSGASGSGKSTMINVMCGLDRPTRGAVLVGGRLDPQADEWASLRRRRIGIVFQDFNLLPVLTAAENVELAMFDTGAAHAARAATARDRLAEVGIAGCANRLPPQLSGGERRRAAIARSLANGPEILLADEPTSNLDSENGALVAKLLLGLHASRGMTMIVASHDPALIAQCPRQIVMKDGRIVSDKTIDASSPGRGTSPPHAALAPMR